MMLFRGCWAVSEQPAVWVWKRSIRERLILSPEALLHDLGPQAPGGPELGDFLQEIEVGVEKEGEPRARTRRP